MINILVDFINHIATEHPEGILLYLFGSVTITWVHLVNRKEVIEGFKGANRMWETPEWTVYIFTFLFPHMIMADQFLGLKASDFAWWFMLSLLLFSLAGRWGLEWLLAFKNGTKAPEEPKKDEQVN